MKIDETKSISDNLTAFGFTHYRTKYVPYRVPESAHAIWYKEEFCGYFTAWEAAEMLRACEAIRL